MTTQHTIDAYRQTAQRVITLTLADAHRLPDLLGRIASAHLRVHGYYTATVGGLRTLYVLTERS